MSLNDNWACCLAATAGITIMSMGLYKKDVAPVR